MLTKEQLQQILTHDNDLDEWYKYSRYFLPKIEIEGTERTAAFFAQCCHESNHFRTLEENMNYSADRLNEVFPKYFVNAGRNALEYHRQPEKIANVVYANRMGNGNEQSGDGWTYRGRGIIQLTGKNNYSKFAADIRQTLERTVRYLSTHKGAYHAAIWYWKENNLNRYVNDFEQLTIKINGGLNGYDHRLALYDRFIDILEEDKPSSDDPVKEGDTGRDVRVIQKLLGIKIDGQFGTKTKQAVMRFQRANGLRVTGVVDLETKVKLLS